MSKDIATMTVDGSTGGEDREEVLFGAILTFSSGLEAMRLTAPDMALRCMCSPSQSKSGTKGAAGRGRMTTIKNK